LTSAKGKKTVSFINSLRSRRDDEEGFTLIELMVVVLIIAILIAIAIPTFLGARQRAQDRAAQSDLRNGLTAEKTVYVDLQAYETAVQDTNPADGIVDMVAVESSLNWNDIKGTGNNVLHATVGDSATPTVVTGAIVCLDEKSKSGQIFSLVDIAAGTKAGTYYGKGTACPATPTEALAVAGSW
jgi:type IV pilus assembly protein PilA